MRIKNKIFVATSVILFISFALINMSSVLDNSIGIGNFIASLLFLVYWGVMFFYMEKNKGIMIYSIVFWLIVLLSNIISLIAATTNASVGFLMIPATFFTAPMFGFRLLILSSTANYVVLLIISAAYVGYSIYSYIKTRYYL